MSDSAYARAGVDQTGAGSAVGALVAVLAGIETGAPSPKVLPNAPARPLVYGDHSPKSPADGSPIPT
jgi:hypothetical protein